MCRFQRLGSALRHVGGGLRFSLCTDGDGSHPHLSHDKGAQLRLRFFCDHRALHRVHSLQDLRHQSILRQPSRVPDRGRRIGSDVRRRPSPAREEGLVPRLPDDRDVRSGHWVCRDLRDLYRLS